MKKEHGIRVRSVLKLKCKVENIFSNEEIKKEQRANILILLRYAMIQFHEEVGHEATHISLDSNMYYLAREALDIEYPSESHWNDKCMWNNVRVAGGCSLKDGEFIISAWENGHEE